MSVELYLFMPRADGSLPPFTDAGLVGADYVCIDCLKWAAYDRRFSDVGLGLTHDDLPAATLVEGAQDGLSGLLMEISLPHWDFVKWTGTDCRDLGAFRRVWDAYEQGEAWLGGDTASRSAAHSLHRELGSFAYLFEQILEAGQQGRVGRWSF